MYDIETFQDLIVFYGGQRGAEARFDSTRTCLENWKSRGIPKGWHINIACDVWIEGKTLNPDLFDMSEHPGINKINQFVEQMSSS